MRSTVLLLLVMCYASRTVFAMADSVRHDGTIIHIAPAADDADDAAAAEADVAERDMLRLHPVNVNTARVDELLAIPSMTPSLANAIIAGRDSLGGFHAMSELRRVAGMSRRDVATIAPFLRIPVSSDNPQTALALRSRVSYDVERAAGFINGAYPGSRPHIYNRLEWSDAHLRCTIVEEKDAGEESVFDHLSGSAMYSDSTWRIIAGDYDAGAGQGLFLWRGVATGKSSEVIRAPLRASFGIQPSRSATEFGTMRGVAASMHWGAVFSTVMISDVWRDASVGIDGSFSALNTSGLHRTTSEMQSHNTVLEQMVGGQAGVRWTSGILAATSTFSTVRHPWNHGDVQRTAINDAGISLRQEVGSATVFGEGAADMHGDIAMEIGGTTKIGDALEGTIVFRNYPRYFFALHPNAFGEHTTAENEIGYYIGARWTMKPDIVVSMYRDVFAFPYPTSTLTLPTSGNETLIHADAALSKEVHGRVLFSVKNAPGMITDTNAAGDITQHEDA